MKKHSQCIDRELGINSTYSIINQMCRSTRVKGAVQDPGYEERTPFRQVTHPA